MENNKAKDLVLELMAVDSENDVIAILTREGFWDDPEAWRFYGDVENNYSTMGNQQSRPEAALVEKLVNSVDARLMNGAYVAGIEPESEDAPQNIIAAVARFFEEIPRGNSSLGGKIRDWTDSKRTEVGRGITLAATGAKPGNGNPCFTISDSGEGQTPDQMPHTLLSINKSNKLRIPFVQGKFNMGGTGVLEFCGEHNIQMILTRRNPEIVKFQGERHQDDGKWSFTVVRREDPRGNSRSSVFTYLAPQAETDLDGRKGVIRFESEEMPIFPEGTDAYSRESGWGTLIKLYNYNAIGFRSNILMSDGLLSRMGLLLPDIALPVRLHECRSYGGHKGSFENTLTGVRVRLDDDKTDNLEDGFPSGAPMKVGGEEFLASIYAFKKGKSGAYRKNEGVIFVVNGQAHGHLTQDFFRRSKIGLSYLSDSILVIVDCTDLSGRSREQLFMPSRDRLRGGELRNKLEASLEDLLKTHPGLRALKEKRRREEISSKLDDSKPLEDILGKLLKKSPALSNLFLQGLRASNPFKSVGAQAEEKKYEGKRFPTFFKFKGKDYGQTLRKDCRMNMRFRIPFETDVTNDYFSRSRDRGEFELVILRDGEEVSVDDRAINLQNGIATLTAALPPKTVRGEEVEYIAKVSDCSRLDPIENKFVVTARSPQSIVRGDSSRRNPPSEKSGKHREKPSGITLPNVITVEEAEWVSHNPPFYKQTALRLKNAGEGGGADGEADLEKNSEIYDFYVNVDNLFLKTEIRGARSEPELVRAQFKYALVLLGLALIQQESDRKQSRSNDDEEVGEKEGSIEDRIEDFTRGVAPVLLPIITSLGELSEDEDFSGSGSGEVA